MGLEISLTTLLITLMKISRVLRKWLETFFRRNMIQVIFCQTLEISKTHRMRDLILKLKNWLDPESLTHYFKEARCKVMRMGLILRSMQLGKPLITFMSPRIPQVKATLLNPSIQAILISLKPN